MGNGIVWVNGCFDVLHVGHIRLLKYAKSLGDFLIVGIDSDDRVRVLKGEERPINNQGDRLEMLMSLKFVDTVLVFDSEQTLADTIKHLKPEHMVVGSEYRGRVVGGEFAKNVHYFDRFSEYSSTRTIEKL